MRLVRQLTAEQFRTHGCVAKKTKKTIIPLDKGELVFILLEAQPAVNSFDQTLF